MALDLKSAQEISPALAPVSEGRPFSRAATRINIQSAMPFAPKYTPANALEPLAGAGVQLTKCVLLIVSGVLALLLGALIYQEAQFSRISAAGLSAALTTAAVIPMAKPESAEQIKTQQELVSAYAAMANASRDFWAKMAQMILLNLLLPVLTALLGYVFASKPVSK